MLMGNVETGERTTNRLDLHTILHNNKQAWYFQ